ncbi:MAG TPA: hypothetical protein VLU25_12120 [Acidobacteriota bacterium]|nr:hypothetical protein [Acidobacteriota bacterium]
MTRFFDLASVPGIRRWLSGKHGSVWDYLRVNGGAELAVAFTALYWPGFIEVDECVLLRENYQPRNFDEWWKELRGDRSRVEEIINHVHLWDLFDMDEAAVPNEGMEELGRILSLTWKCALHHQFPERKFEVHLALDDSEYGPTLSFYTSR